MTRDFRFQFRFRLTDTGEFVVPVLGMRKDKHSPFSLFVLLLCYLLILAKKINRGGGGEGGGRGGGGKSVKKKKML